MNDVCRSKTITVLVVDDDETVVGLIKTILTKAGYSVVTGANGHEGITMANQEKPDLVLMDITMPDMDGYEATAQIKQLSGLHDIPVIFLTGRSASEDGGRAFASGAITFVRKPFSNQQLLDLVALTMQSVNG